ncbi:MAG: hypothetical protein R6U91_09970 [Bacillota bacterium]
MDSEELERVCFNCTHFFPASDELTEYGICLDDEDFAPYIKDLLEDFNFASCQDLIDKKKFSGDYEGCENFEVAEILEIDNDSPLEELLNTYKETGEIDEEKLEKAIFEEQIKNIDLKTLPVEPYAEKLESGGPEEQKEALQSLGGLVSQGNREAFKALFDYLKKLPPPERINEVHTKIDILENLKASPYPEQKIKLISLLMDELYKVASNNTTRQWITKILEYLADLPEAEIRPPLEALLEKRQFPLRTRKKIEAFLDQ